MGARENQLQAADAVAYVKQQRLYGDEKEPRAIVAFNNADRERWDPLLRVRSDSDFAKMRERFSVAQSNLRKAKGPEKLGKRSMKVAAGMALESGHGNCTEQAALAFRFLKTRGVFPLDVMKATYRARFADLRLVDDAHLFVLIGRPDGTASRDIGSWGTDAVVCDPWAPRTFQVYMASRLPVKLNAVLEKFELEGSIARINGRGESEW